MERLTDAPGPAAGRRTELLRVQVRDLVRLAILILGDPAAAEHVVRGALFGRRRLSAPGDQDRAVADARASVLDGCRDVRRRRSPDIPAGSRMPLGEEHRGVLAALHLLPGLQREAVVLRYCLGLPAEEAAQAMGVSQDTVRSASHRGLAALAQLLTRPPLPWPMP